MGVSSYDMAGSDWATLRHVPTPEASAAVTHIQILCTKCGAGTSSTKKTEVLLPDVGQAKMTVVTRPYK